MRRHKDPSRRQSKQKTIQAQQTEDPQAEDTPSPEDNPSGRQPKRKTTQAQKTPATPTAATTATSTGALHPLRGGAPVMWRCTRYVAVHPLRGAAPEQKRCIAYGSGAAPQQTRTNAELAHRTTHRRTPPCAAGPYWWQDGHAAHATTCTSAHSDTSHTLTCEEPVYVRYSRLAHAIAGSRASDTPGRAPLCPKRRPPRPCEPIVGVFRRGGLHFGRHASPNRDLTTPNRDLTTPNRDLTTPNRDLTASKRGNCTNRATTRRRHAEARLLMLQNPHHYPWRHAPSLASRSLTGAGQPGGTPINARKASPTWPVAQAQVGRAPINAGKASPVMAGASRATSSTTGLVPIRQNTPSVIIQRVLIGRNALDQVESSLTGRMPPNGLNAPDQESSSRWCASCLRRRGAGVRAQASSLDDARDRAATNTL